MVAPWKKIDSARRGKGISQKEMAERIGISQTAVQKWKNGGSISYENVVALARVLDTTTNELLCDNPGLASHASGFSPATKPGSSDMPIRDHRPPSYSNAHATPPQPLCRFPADCDLVQELSAQRSAQADVQAQLATLSTQVETLTRLLGATLAANANGVAHEKQKAG